MLAVFHRTSLGVAGLAAASRFHVGPSELSVFVLLQLGVYAGMQIPTGILVDRFGPRRLLVAASLTMGLAQLLFAFADNYPMALFARALLGCGDALTFVSVLRFAAGQFSPTRYPAVIAVTATLGTVGNIVATAPLTLSLHGLGWTPTFAVAGTLSLVTGIAVFLVLPASGPVTAPGARTDLADGAAPIEGFGSPRRRPIGDSLRTVLQSVRTAWGTAGTKAGFWVHFTSMSTALMIGVLWGVPFMVDGQGMTRGEAGTVLLASVVVGAGANPVLGYVAGRFPACRLPIGIGVVVMTIVGWLTVLAVYSGPIPRGLLIALIVFTAVGGPVSTIGFALARDYNAPAIVGTATGVVNVGGFVAGTVASLLVGWDLDLAGSTSRSSYRLAFAVALVVQILGLIQLVHWWLRARHSVLRDHELGIAVPVPIVRHRWDLT